MALNQQQRHALILYNNAVLFVWHLINNKGMLSYCITTRCCLYGINQQQRHALIKQCILLVRAMTCHAIVITLHEAVIQLYEAVT